MPRPLPPAQTLTPRRLDLQALSDVRFVETYDGIYICCVCAGVTWQLWMEYQWPGPHHYAFELTYDSFTPLRAHETIRFWRVLAGFPRRCWLRASLCALSDFCFIQVVCV